MLEDLKHLAAITRTVLRWTRSHRVLQVARSSGKSPRSFGRARTGGRAAASAKYRHQFLRRRFDIQFCVKKLSQVLTKPQKLDNFRLAWLERKLVDTEKLVLRLDHHKHDDTLRIVLESGWTGSEERYSTHAGLENISWFRGCIRLNASIEFRRDLRSRERLDSTRDIFTNTCTRRWTNHQHRRRNGFDGCDRDVLPNDWKDQTQSSLIVDPRRHS